MIEIKHYCYFCGKPNAELKTLIKHDDIDICDECVWFATTILRDHHWKQNYEARKEFGP
jgi:ATP-dependent protease Clp ATPase subunit